MNNLFLILTVEFKRKDILSAYPWLEEKNLPFMISADYDGLICASFLHHHLGWDLAGYYDLSCLWVSNNAIENHKDLIWVDLNILPRQGRAIGGHIISPNGEIPKGFKTSCNPNITAGLTADNFKEKFPFQIEKNLLARMLVLHSDAAWLKCQEYPDNIKAWQKQLTNFNWHWLLQKITSHNYEKRVDEILYPELLKIGAVSGTSKLTSKLLKIKSRQFQFNPDWDDDIIINLFNLFGNALKWTPPKLPYICKRIDGHREKVRLSKVKDIGLNAFLKKNQVFSYAIPSPRVFNYTTFGPVRSPMDGNI